MQACQSSVLDAEHKAIQKIPNNADAGTINSSHHALIIKNQPPLYIL